MELYFSAKLGRALIGVEPLSIMFNLLRVTAKVRVERLGIRLSKALDDGSGIRALIFRGEAIAEGDVKYLKKKLREWLAMRDDELKRFLRELRKDKQTLIPKNSLSGAASIQRMRRVNQQLRNSRAVFNPLKDALKKIGIRLFKSKNGLAVDFSKTPKYLYGGKKSSQSIVKIKLRGRRSWDFRAAWKEVGFTKEQIRALKDDYMWHHLDDFDSVTGEGTMQLVEKALHKACSPHIGSVKQVEDFFNIKYKD